MSVLDERDVTPRRWTRAEFDRMVEVGLLGQDDRVELIDGEILNMAPQDSQHAATIMRVHETLQQAFGAGRSVRAQLPLALDPCSEPEPDFAVVEGTWRDYVDGHPATALLVVEVALTSLAYDRRRKASLYSRARISEYWVINLRDRCLEVYRDPVASADARYGHDYSVVESLNGDATVTPLAAPGSAIAVADLLP